MKKGPIRAAMQSAVTEHFILFPEPGQTADLLRGLWQCALASKDFGVYSVDERSETYAQMEAIIRLNDELHALAQQLS